MKTRFLSKATRREAVLKLSNNDLINNGKMAISKMIKGVSSMIRCIATDMDGTLLNLQTQQIPPENKQAILEAQTRGIEVVIATGRSYDEVDFLLEEADLKCPAICANGAEIRTKEGKIIAKQPIDKREARMAASILTRNDVYYELYTDKGKFTKDRDKSISIMIDMLLGKEPDINQDKVMKFATERAGQMQQIDDYEILFSGQTCHIYKFLVFSFDSDRLNEMNQDLEKLENIVITSSGHGNLEINHKCAQKGIALEKFVLKKGISLSETMAIGDGFNDVSMFNRVGRSVAMGNAPERIKTQCDFVTAINEENGVAKAIWDALHMAQK